MGQTTSKTRKWRGARGVKDRNGVVSYWYVKPLNGGREVKITAEYGTPEWEEQYVQARGGESEPTRPTPHRRAASYGKITLGEAIEKYRRSTTYADLAKASVEKRDIQLRNFIRWGYEDAPLAELKQDKLIDLLIDKKPKAHYEHVLSIRMLYRFINERANAAGEAKLADPTIGYPFPKKTDSKGFRIWQEQHIELFRAGWPLGSIERTIFELAYGTAQRGSDILRMRKSHIVDLIANDGTSHRAIHVASQEKTKASVTIPISDELQQALDAWQQTRDRRKAELIANRGCNFGRNWIAPPNSKTRQRLDREAANADRRREVCGDLILVSPNRLHTLAKHFMRSIMRNAIQAVGLPVYQQGEDDTFEHGFSLHGLRKSAMSQMAEAGVTTLGIMAISGHTSQRNVDWYTREMEKTRLAVSAIEMRQALVQKRAEAKAKAAGKPDNVVALKTEQK